MAITITLGSLNLMDNAKHAVLGRDYDFSTPGVIGLMLAVKGASADALATNFQNIVNELRKADKAASGDPGEAWVELLWQLDTTAPVYYAVTGGTIVPTVIHPTGLELEAALTLFCLPYARGAAESVTVAGTLTNGAAQFLVDNVLGDTDALTHLELTDTSAAGVIQRIRTARRSSSTISALGDFDPWVDATAMSGATEPADGTAFGGTYATRTTSSTTFGNIARSVMPAGVLNKGRRDLWARVYDTATAMSAPTGTSAAPTAPTVLSSATTTAYTASETPNVRQSVAGYATDASATLTDTLDVRWTSNTLNGSCLLARQSIRVGTLAAPVDGFDPSLLTLAAPAGWLFLANQAEGEGSLSSVYTNWWYKPAAATVTTATAQNFVATWSSANGNTWDHSVEIVEAESVSAIAVLRRQRWPTIDTQGAASTSSGTYTVTQSDLDLPAIPSLLALSWAYLPYIIATDNVYSWLGGSWAEEQDVNGATLVSQLFTGGSDLRHDFAVTATSESYVYGYTFILYPDYTTSDSTAYTYQEPTPGSLLAGTYGFRIQAVDPVGTLGNACATFNGVVAADQSSLVLAWTAPSGTVSHYKITYSLDGKFYWFYTPDNTTAYTMTSTAGHAETSALPATTGAVAPPARLRARIGTAGTDTTDLIALPEIVLTGDGSWQLVKLGSARDLPPVGEQINGDQPEWAVETQHRSANGLSAVTRVDALWLPPSDEPQMTLEFAGLDLATKRRWVAETDRRGRSTSAWLENTGTGAEASQVSVTGVLVLSPGDNIVALQVDQDAGVDSQAATVTATLSYYPRFVWGRGT